MKRSTRCITIVALLIAMQMGASLAAVMDSSSMSKSAPAKPATTSFTQPTFNFDFSSLMDRKSAQDAMSQTRSNWGNFFTEKPKPVFSEELTNVVKGSSNELRGTQNEIEGSKNKVIGMQNSLFGDENSIFGLKNSIFGSQNTILKGNENIIKGSQNTLKGNNNLVDGNINKVNGNANSIKGNLNNLIGD